MNVGEYIKMLRTQKGISQEELGKVVGVQRAAVQKWEAGTVHNLKRNTIKKLADYFCVSPINFIELGAPDISNDNVTFPVIGEVAAGFDKIAIEDWTGDTINIPVDFLKDRKQEEYFVLRVKGDSMYPDYRDGDKILVLKQTAIDYSGQIAVVIYGDDFGTIKKVEQRPNCVKLVPINPLYPPEEIKDVDIEKIHIIGIPKILIRDLTED